jgi:hypothetical protein
MSLHPHLHCIVPSGGLTETGEWKDCKKGGNFFARFSDIADLFRKHYLNYIVEYWENGQLEFGNDPGLQPLAEATYMSKFIEKLRKKSWNLRVGKPMSGVQQVVNYLGRYIYRIAIANSRILEIGEKSVRFTVKDYAATTDPSQPVAEKEMELEGVEFLRRFAQHILPPSFQRVRYYGFYAAAAKTRLDKAKQLIGNRDWCYALRTVVQIIAAMIGFDPDICPCCGAKGQWLVKEIPSYWAARQKVLGSIPARAPPVLSSQVQCTAVFTPCQLV